MSKQSIEQFNYCQNRLKELNKLNQQLSKRFENITEIDVIY